MGILHACGEQAQMLGWGSNFSPAMPESGKLVLLSCLDRGEGLYPLSRWRFLPVIADAGCFVMEGKILVLLKWENGGGDRGV